MFWKYLDKYINSVVSLRPLSNLFYSQGTFRVYPLPADGSDPPPRMLKNVPCNQLVEVNVRVYVVRAMELQPQDPNGLSDPYLAFKLGRFKVKDRENYVPKQLNPTFGK